MDILKYMASHDDVLKFCRTDFTLAKRFFENFPDKCINIFDPIISAASNPELIKSTSIWSKKGNLTKKALHTFDEELYTKVFIKARLAFLENNEKNEEPKRFGFDAYQYLMVHEKDIKEIYKNEELNSLQKAALYFIESGKPEEELNYLTYVASYDDVIVGAINSKPEEKSWDEWLKEY